MDTRTTLLETVTLREKMALIFNTNLWSDTHLNESNINIVKLLEDYTSMEKEVRIFQALADSWNLELVKKYAELKALNAQSNHIVVIPFGLIRGHETRFYGVDHISDNLHYVEKILSTYVSALKEKGMAVIGLHDHEKEKEVNQTLLDMLLNLGLDAIIFNHPAPNMDHIRLNPLIVEKGYHDGQVLYILLNKISTMDVEAVEDSFYLYEEQEKRLGNHEITQEEFDAFVRDNIVFCMDDIEEIIMSIYDFTDKVYHKRPFKPYVDDGSFFSAELENFYKALAHESSVFYKKDDHLLESMNIKTVAFVGDFFGTRLTKKDVQAYYPACIGFYDHESISDIISKPGAVIVKLNRSLGEDPSQEEQLSVIQDFSNKGVPVVAIVPSDFRHSNMDWMMDCAVVIKADLFDVASLNGLLDVLTLKNQALGCLSKGMWIEEASSSETKGYLFYGLNESRFKYKRLSYQSPYLECTVSNLDSKSNVDIIQVYVRDEAKSERDQLFVGFQKINLKGKESRTISIPLELAHVGKDYSQSSLVVEVKTIHANLTLTIHPNQKVKEVQQEPIKEAKKETIQENREKYNRKTKKQKTSVQSRLLTLIMLLAYFNVPMAYIIDRLVDNLYRFMLLIVMVFVNYLIFKFVFRPRKYEQEETDLKTLIKAVEDIEYLEAEEEIVFDHELVYDDEDFDLNVVVNEPNQTLVAEEVFQDELDMGKYCEKLRDYLEANGLKSDTQQLRQLFSMIMGSRLLVTASNEHTLTIKFLNYFSNFIGGRLFVESAETSRTTFDRLLSNGQSELNKCIESARTNPDTLHFMVFPSNDLEKAQHHFAKLLDYIEDPHKWADENHVNIPENMWFMIVPKESTRLSERLLLKTFMLDLDIESIEPTEQIEQSIIQLGYYYLIDRFTDSKEVFFLPEELWKKIDQLELYLSKHYGFSFDNQFIRQLERYQTMYLMCKGEPMEAIDSLLKQKILPILLNKPVVTIPQDEENLSDICDRLFGLDQLLQSRHLLATLNHKTID